MGNNCGKASRLNVGGFRYNQITTKGKLMNTMNFIDENGLCATDNVCVFCSIMTDGWNRFCPRCKDYKGMMRLPQAIETYGAEIIGY